MPSLRIRVGASVDGSVATSFASIEKAAQRTGAIIAKALGGQATTAAKQLAAAAAGAAGPYRQAGAAAAAAGRQAVTAASSLGQVATGAQAKFQALQATLKKLPVDLQTLSREANRALQSMEREKARAALGLGSTSRPSRFWFGAGGNLAIKKPHIETLDMDPVRGAARFGMSAASFAARSAMGLARAAGVDTDLGDIMSRNVKEESRAQQISNSAYQPGVAGPAGQLVAKEDLLKQTRQVGIDTGTERGDLLGGLQKFVALTGDLKLGRDMLGQMAVLARATGSDFTEMAAATAEVSNHLGDIPDKGAATLAVMRQITGEGKLGAIEVRDLARQMAKLASHAGMFQGGAAQNIAMLGAVAQEAKLRGGATNAAQATTAVVRFTEELTKGSVLKKLSKAKVDVFTDQSGTQLKSFPDIVKAMLSYTKGDLRKLDQVMPSSIGKKALGGFSAIYSETSGSDADKIRAVTNEFERLQSAQMSEEEVQRAFTASMKTSEAASKQFNERIAAASEEIQSALLPALLELAPTIIDVAKGFASLATSNFAQDLLATLGLGKGSQANDAAKSLKAQNEAEAYKGTMWQWEKTHLMTNAESASTPEQIKANLAAAQPLLDTEAAKEAEVKGAIDPLAKRVAEEGKKLRGMGNRGLGGDSTDEDIKKNGGTEGRQYLEDKATLNRLQETLTGIHTERDRLIQVLQSGAVTVKIAAPMPRPAPGGSQPADGN